MEALTMGILDLFRRKAEPAPERRSGMAAGYTAQILEARQSFIAGSSGIAELTATVQGCVSLWEGCFALADVTGTNLLTRAHMAMMARGLALRGEAVFLIDGGVLVPVADWDLSTRNGIPRAYRCSVSEAGGGRAVTALAAEVLHIRSGADTVTPWAGRAPLRRAALSASLLHEIETALRDVFRDSPMGSQTLPLPAITSEQMAQYDGAFTGRRGRTLVFAAEPTGDMIKAPSPAQLTPRLADAESALHLDAGRDAICVAFGVLPGLFNRSTTGPMVREAQRHLAGWTLQPLAMVLAEEASAKLGTTVEVDLMRPVQAYDAGGRARALSAVIGALVQAKEAGLDPAALNSALTLVNWGEGDNAA
jgi:hypothetical protein